MGKLVVLISDTATVGMYLKQGGSVSKVMCDLARKIVHWSELHLVALLVRYSLRKKNILVDQLNRPDQVLPVEWLILPLVLDAICEVFALSHIGSHGMETRRFSTSVGFSDCLHFSSLASLRQVLLRVLSFNKALLGASHYLLPSLSLSPPPPPQKKKK